MLAALLGASEFRRLQALCKDAYKTSISRSLQPISVNHSQCVMHYYDEVDGKVKFLTFDGTKCRQVTNDLIDLKMFSKTIVAGNSLIVFDLYQDTNL